MKISMGFVEDVEDPWTFGYSVPMRCDLIFPNRDLYKEQFLIVINGG